MIVWVEISLLVERGTGKQCVFMIFNLINFLLF